MEDSFSGQADAIARFAEGIADAFTQGGRLLVCGGGPLAAIAELTASRFLHRLSLDRPQLPALALAGGDVLFQSLARDGLQRQYYLRQLRVLAAAGDVLLLMADGRLDDAQIEALQFGRQMGCLTAVIMPAKAEILSDPPEHLFPLETDSPARCAEAALFFGQLLCELVEAELFGN
jgi:D-sedoheptulose 7-phosphate isomerase